MEVVVVDDLDLFVNKRGLLGSVWLVLGVSCVEFIVYWYWVSGFFVNYILLIVIILFLYIVIVILKLGFKWLMF